MLKLVTTLIRGAAARHEDLVTNHFAIDLLQEKVRESDDVLRRAKDTLALLILKERQERRLLDVVLARKADLESRATLALAGGSEDMAREAAQAIADLENEARARSAAVERLRERSDRMRLSLEKNHRRIIDLKLGVMTAKAVDAERKAQASMNRIIGRNEPIREAEELIARVLGADDPVEETEILEGIDLSLSHSNMQDRLAAAGYGAPTKVTAADVLRRLQNSARPA
ncbi:PspA/IM30 family protein [Rhizobium sp. RU36D]|uniref:PspA/IM30 family protein n=1 Tax=Rhizobium sp. RU36D TaxID=1907415 RepID=UPI0009D8FD43|nr:PspA/IM30 family protein [Rhizobium sp. RU36D]SMD15737.1 phage shock protein A (PspA) family protein [Rhizobium sp. RU36D]